MYERAKPDLTSTKPSDDNELWRNMFFVMFADPDQKKPVHRRQRLGALLRYYHRAA